MQMNIPPSLLNIVLEEFQSALFTNLNHPWEARFGQPPKYGYLEHSQWMEEGFRKTTPISAWHISTTTIHETRIKVFAPNLQNKISFDLFYGWFYFSDDLSTVDINWQTGPRFGRGFSHRIGKDSLGEYLLDRGKSTWVS
jgi:hypothetical protein